MLTFIVSLDRTCVLREGASGSRHLWNLPGRRERHLPQGRGPGISTGMGAGVGFQRSPASMAEMSTLAVHRPRASVQ